ncbi:hypothetical protein GCM10025734_70140 [Kitasatospora paranensis]
MRLGHPRRGIGGRGQDGGGEPGPAELVVEEDGEHPHPFGGQLDAGLLGEFACGGLFEGLAVRVDLAAGQAPGGALAGGGPAAEQDPAVGGRDDDARPDHRAAGRRARGHQAALA